MVAEEENEICNLVWTMQDEDRKKGFVTVSHDGKRLCYYLNPDRQEDVMDVEGFDLAPETGAVVPEVRQEPARAARSDRGSPPLRPGARRAFLRPAAHAPPASAPATAARRTATSAVSVIGLDHLRLPQVVQVQHADYFIGSVHNDETGDFHFFHFR